MYFIPLCTGTTYYLQVSEHDIHTLAIDTHVYVYEVLSKYIQHAKDGPDSSLSLSSILLVSSISFPDEWEELPSEGELDWSVKLLSSCLGEGEGEGDDDTGCLVIREDIRGGDQWRLWPLGDRSLFSGEYDRFRRLIFGE